MQRTLSKDAVGLIGQTVFLQGWIHARRDMGRVAFVDLRDRAGLIQVVLVPSETDEASRERIKDLRPEFCVAIMGTVQARGEKQINPSMPTGTVEVLAKTVEILNESKTPPFEVSVDTSSVNEELRLKYRYLDLRTERLRKNLRLRNDFVQGCRNFLLSEDFLEVETPYLTKATPEGSRDFVVPSRLQPGKFFALPQAPQQYKQLLMVAGFERYFQLARAFRDEDPRADRGFEHTQVDIEMSFVNRDDVIELIERMVTHVVESLGYTLKQKPFPRITYAESMATHGADKFDLRTEEEKKNGVLAYAWVVDFPFFEKTGTGGWTFTHNPFSMPKPEYVADHLAGRNVGNILTTQYDLVCNGHESGGGSIRAHDPRILKATYKIMGCTDAEIEESVGHMLEAFEYGAPPHGGIALGVERNLMNLTGEAYLHEVQAFPMTGSAHTSVMDAPSALEKKILDELHISVKK